MQLVVVIRTSARAAQHAGPAVGALGAPAWGGYLVGGRRRTTLNRPKTNSLPYPTGKPLARRPTAAAAARLTARAAPAGLEAKRTEQRYTALFRYCLTNIRENA